MTRMFRKSKFNGDINNWDVSNVTDMLCMFQDSNFNRDISSWNIYECETDYIFQRCPIRDEYKPKIEIVNKW